WAPYDNRPGTNPSHALADYAPRALLLPFTEGNVAVFRCPLGIDPQSGQPFQVSYAWNSVTLGPAGKPLSAIASSNGTSQVVLAWEHAQGPQCLSGPPRNRTWNRVDLDTAHLHYPDWHAGVCHFLFADGHGAGLVRAEIQKSLFYVVPPPE